MIVGWRLPFKGASPVKPFPRLSDRLWERYQFPTPPVKRASRMAIMPHSFRIWKDSFPTRMPARKEFASGPEPNRAAAIDADEAALRARFRRGSFAEIPTPAGAAVSVRPAAHRKKYFGCQRSDFFCQTINFARKPREYQSRTGKKDRFNLQNIHIC